MSSSSRPPVSAWWPAAFAALVTAVVFWPSVGYGFVNFDDDVYVTENPRVLAGLTPDGVWWALTTRSATNWHPLTWLSLELDSTLFGPVASAYHRTNVLLHAAAVGLTYLALRRLTDSVGRSLAVALLFAVHPLRVESVTWVSERKDVLSTLFLVATVLVYQRYAVVPSRGRMAAVVGAFALGLAAKPMLVTLPFALLLLDFWPLGRLRSAGDVKPLVREKAALFALALVSCAVTVYAQGQGGAVQDLDRVPLAVRVTNAPVACLVYLGVTVWPADLAVYYPVPYDPRPVWQWATAAAVLAGTTVAAFALRRTAPYLVVGWLWYLGTLVPVIGLIQVGSQAYADRYTYVPHLGLITAAVWGVADILQRLRVPLGVAVALTGLAVAACAVLTIRQQHVWSDSALLWEHAIAVTPEGNATSHFNLATHWFTLGRRDEAEAEYRLAADTADPASPVRGWALANLTKMYLQANRFDEAERAANELAEARVVSPADRAVGFFVLGEIHRRNGRPGPAADRYRDAIRACDYWAPRLHLGLLLAETGHPDESLESLQAAQKLGPDMPECNHALGSALGERKEWAAAVPFLQKAVELRPDAARYRGSWAVALLEVNRTDDARREAREAARLDPNWVEQTRRRAWASATSADPAVRDGKKALRLAFVVMLASDPNPVLLDTLAAASAEAGRYDDAVKIAERAAAMATESGDGSLAAAIRGRAARYRSKQPYRETGA